SFGGAIHNARGTVTVTASTFSGNRAGSFGGTIRTYDGTLTVTASTFNDNGAACGGALGNTHDSTVIVTASTISSNSANSGGAINTFLGVARLRGTILAGNGGGNCGGDRVTAEGYNLSDDSSCSGIPSSSNINLGELTDNGGPTLTMLPANDSPAIDAIPEAECSTHSTPTDQRGAPRPAGAGCDIGAVEADASVPLQRFAAEASGGPEGQPLPIIAAAAGSSESPLSYQVDCDNDDEYETEGITKPLGEASASIGLATCTFADEGEYPVGLKTCSGDDCLTTAFSVTVHNVAPALETPVVTPTPSKEGELVEVSVAFTDTGSQDSHTCTIDYGDGSAPEDGTVDQAAGTCTGQHTYRDDASEPFTITITVTDDAEASARIEVKHTVEN